MSKPKQVCRIKVPLFPKGTEHYHIEVDHDKAGQAGYLLAPTPVWEERVVEVVYADEYEELLKREKQWLMAELYPSYVFNPETYADKYRKVKRMENKVDWMARFNLRSRCIHINDVWADNIPTFYMDADGNQLTPAKAPKEQ